MPSADPGADRGLTAGMAQGQPKSITLVAAMASNRAIGLRGAMPWHLPAELAHFKVTTMGKSLVMGRKTWDSIGRALPGRQNIVVTRNTGFEAPGCEVANSLDHAIELAGSSEVMVIGGGMLYELALPLAQRMVLTHIDCEAEADTWFPEWDPSEWVPVSREHFAADHKSGLAYDIVEYEKIKPVTR